MSRTHRPKACSSRRLSPLRRVLLPPILCIVFPFSLLLCPAFDAGPEFEEFLRRTAGEILDRMVHDLVEEVDRIVWEEGDSAEASGVIL